MLAKVVESRVVARVAIVMLALGVFALAGLALVSTATIERSTAQIAAGTEIGDAWGHLFDHVNLEEDMMHAYLGTRDEAQRRAFAQTIGGAEPILAKLLRMGDRDTQVQAAQAAEAYRSYTATLKEILAFGRDPAKLAAKRQRGEFAAAAVRQLVAASLASQRQGTRAYAKRVDRGSRNLRIAASAALSACLGLLALCTAVLLGYQRRVERQAASSRHDALHDALTGLANRILLGDRIKIAMDDSDRRGGPVGLLLIDLDGFKEVNDTLGHKFGDLVLQEVATRLNATMRETDVVARLGGDEFAVLLPQLSAPDEATAIAERLVTVLRRPVSLDQYVMEVGSSIGVAVYPTNCADADQLLQHADIAMYTAKRGRRGAAMYDPSQNSYHPKQLTLLAELRRALDGDEIVLHYQPKADTVTGQIRGVEALVRWQHPVHGLMPPGEFIALAEGAGLINQLTFHVLGMAIEQCRAWERDGLCLPVAINVSVKCLTDADFAWNVGALLREKQFAAEMLTLEITETAVINNPEQALGLLKEIRAMGIGLSIDDFGTGYSSMAYLQDMPITELKIDRSFVSRMIAEANNRAIVHAVLELAHSLNLQVVAEGVEDQQTFDELTALGCQLIQGFFVSRPLPAAHLEDWIARHHTALSQRAA